MEKRIKLCIILLFMPAAQLLCGQDISGTWRTIDDRTGQSKALVEIYNKEDKMYGVIKKIFIKGMEDARCTDCNGNLKNKPFLGMKIIAGLKKTGQNRWEGDTLFDPEQRRYFRCRIWLNPEAPDELKVRGYWMILHRTQTWKRVTQPM
jgi:uncharacterized protein (DUF2147 family)